MRYGYDLPQDAHALQPVRVVDGALRVYTAWTGAPGKGREFCDTELRRMLGFGLTKIDGREYAVLDILNVNDDIVMEYGLTRKGFRQLYYKLGCRWENREEWEANRRETIAS